MGNRTLFVSKEDDAVWVHAAEVAQARGVSLSRLVTEMLREVDGEPLKDAWRRILREELGRGHPLAVVREAVPAVVPLPRPRAEGCPHPPGRRVKNGTYCGACGKPVEKGTRA